MADDGKASEVVILDVRGVSGATDYFVVFTSSSQNHLRALGKRIREELGSFGVEPLHVDGLNGSGWVVLDYGNVIIHAMLGESRHYYDLERLWGDAAQVAWA